jgi:hypothetical protein
MTKSSTPRRKLALSVAAMHTTHVPVPTHTHNQPFGYLPSVSEAAIQIEGSPLRLKIAPTRIIVGESLLLKLHELAGTSFHP